MPATAHEKFVSAAAGGSLRMVAHARTPPAAARAAQATMAVLKPSAMAAGS